MGFLWVCTILKEPFEIPYVASSIITASQGPFIWTSLREFFVLCWECIKRLWHKRNEAEGDSEEKGELARPKEREGEPGKEQKI